jgi:hypothetical protein
VKQSFKDALLTAFKKWMIDTMKQIAWSLVAFSLKNWTAEPVFQLWMDDAFDTQRRRGQDPTLKDVQPAEAGTPLIKRAPLYVTEYADRMIVPVLG